MPRIICPHCQKSNRAKRKTCALCGDTISHLRGPKGPAAIASTRAAWLPNGTRVGVLRTDHGWFGGSFEGVLISPGIVRDDEGYIREIRRPLDVYACKETEMQHEDRELAPQGVKDILNG